MKIKVIFLVLVLFLISLNPAFSQIKTIVLSIDQTGVETCINTSIENLKGKSFELYPNPNDGNFTLKIDPALSIRVIKLEISDNTGKILFMDDCIEPEEFREKRISLANIKPGLYIVSIYSKKEVFTKNIIINK